MVNQVRALLLNLAPPAVYGPTDGFVPVGYTPRRLPPRLQAAMDAVFGRGADRDGKNQTLDRLLAYAAASPNLAPTLTADDPRTVTVPAAVPAGGCVVGGPVAGGRVTGGLAFDDPGRGGGRWVYAYAASGSTMQTWAGRFLLDPSAPVGGYVSVGLTGSRLVLGIPTAQYGTWAVQAWGPPAHAWAAAAAADPTGIVNRGLNDTDDVLEEVWRTSGAVPERAAAFAVALSRRVGELEA
jgi:hypothetical protein